MKRTSFFVAFGMSLSSGNGHTKCNAVGEKSVFMYFIQGTFERRGKLISVLHSRYI